VRLIYVYMVKETIPKNYIKKTIPMKQYQRNNTKETIPKKQYQRIHDHAFQNRLVLP